MINHSRNFPEIISIPKQEKSVFDWLILKQEFIHASLETSGALLIRGIEPLQLSNFQALITRLFGEPLNYEFGSTPRTQLQGKIYSSTEYPATKPIPLHNEKSYTLNWPSYIAFMCVTKAEAGGQTPIADSRLVYENIPVDIRDRFETLGLCYVRNYAPYLDVSWQQTFRTDNRAEVESFCNQNKIQYEWKPNDVLRTKQYCQSVLRHPKTQEIVWFNQAHLFHISTLPDRIQKYFIETFGKDDLPRNVYFGDGSDIDEEMLWEIGQVYAEHTNQFEWEEGDILLLDNILSSHGRTPYTGERKIVVGMV